MSRNNLMQAVLSILSVLLFGLLVTSLLFRVVPDQNRELVSTALGFIAGNMLAPAFQWFFGSTIGSERKTQALVDAARPPAGAATITAAPDVDVQVRQPPPADED